jgi:hypothetical protein
VSEARHIEALPGYAKIYAYPSLLMGQGISAFANQEEWFVVGNEVYSVRSNKKLLKKL